MKTLLILQLSVLLAAISLNACKNTPEKIDRSEGVDNSNDNYLESVKVVKAALGPSYLDTNFTILDSIAPTKKYFLDSFCIAMISKDTTLANLNLKASLDQQRPQRNIWTEVPGFRFKRFSNETLDSIKADRTGDLAKIEKMFGHGFWSISYPLFFNHKQYCLVGLTFTCGPMCANSRVLLCKHFDGRWAVVRTYCEAVS